MGKMSDDRSECYGWPPSGPTLAYHGIMQVVLSYMSTEAGARQFEPFIKRQTSSDAAVSRHKPNLPSTFCQSYRPRVDMSPSRLPGTEYLR